MPNIISCPQCAMQLKVPDTLAVGAQVKCPRCNGTFAVPAAAPPPPPQPGQFSAAPQRPSPAAPGAFSTQGAPPPGRGDFDFGDGAHRPMQAQGMEGLSSDYMLDISECFNSGMQHYSAVLGPMVGYGFIIVGINLFLSCMGQLPFIGILAALIQGAMALFVTFALEAGYLFVSLQQLRGRGWAFGDLFAGFRWWVPLFLNHLIKFAVSLALMLPGAVMLIGGFASFLMKQPGGPFGPPVPPSTTFPPPQPASIPPSGFEITLMVGGGILLFLMIIPSVYVNVRWFLLNHYFIIDRGCGPVEAIKANWAVTKGHFWPWFGLSFLLGLILGGAGLFTCGLGTPFVYPIFYLVLTTAWMRIVSSKGSEGPV